MYLSLARFFPTPFHFLFPRPPPFTPLHFPFRKRGTAASLPERTSCWKSEVVAASRRVEKGLKHEPGVNHELATMRFTLSIKPSARPFAFRSSLSLHAFLTGFLFLRWFSLSLVASFLSFSLSFCLFLCLPPIPFISFFFSFFFRRAAFTITHQTFPSLSLSFSLSLSLLTLSFPPRFLFIVLHSFLRFHYLQPLVTKWSKYFRYFPRRYHFHRIEWERFLVSLLVVRKRSSWLAVRAVRLDR